LNRSFSKEKNIKSESNIYYHTHIRLFVLIKSIIEKYRTDFNITLQISNF
jgi:hypothetical protein